MQPVCSENFRPFPIMSCSCEKRYQALHVTESLAGLGNEAREGREEGKSKKVPILAHQSGEWELCSCIHP